MRTRLRTSLGAGALVLSCAQLAAASPPQAGTNQASGSAVSPAKYELGFPLRVGASAVPLVGYSVITAGWGEPHTLGDGGWVVLDVAPAVRLRGIAAGELAVGAMIPVEDAWGFPDFRIAVTPGFRLDGRLFYGRLGLPLMFGEGTGVGFEGAFGVTFWGPLYAGPKAFVSLGDLILFAGGLEVGARFDDLRLVW